MTRLEIVAAVVAGSLLPRAPAAAARGGSLDVPAGVNAVVAADGSGDFRSVQAAIDAAPQNPTAASPWVIFVRAGRYRELVYVQREKRQVVLVGEDPARTVITYDLRASTLGPDRQPVGTFRTPTVTVDADDFTAENLTFENDAGPVGQAVAVRVDGDRVVFRNCRFLGWQDTLLLNRGRQYIEESLIAGHVDFVFGGATAFLSRCRLHCWRNGYITAASTPREARYGLVIADSTITAESPDVRAYLGRPWRDFASVLFLRTAMGAVVRPAGWHNWDRPERQATARFMEYGNAGPGADRRERVPWSKALTAADADAVSVRAVLGGADAWDPAARPSHGSRGRAIGPPFPTPGAK